MVRGGVDMLFLDFSMVHYITMLLHFLIHYASVPSAVYATLKAHYIFLLIVILLSSLWVVQVNVLLYSDGLRIICDREWENVH